jgi:hypothetical protein
MKDSREFLLSCYPGVSPDPWPEAVSPSRSRQLLSAPPGLARCLCGVSVPPSAPVLLAPLTETSSAYPGLSIGAYLTAKVVSAVKCSCKQ